MDKIADKDRIRVRFNLGRGKNFMKWKVEVPGQKAFYLDPSKHQLLMQGCSLRNRHTVAEQILAGANKSVCAWVLCNSLDVIDLEGEEQVPSQGFEVHYNPRIRPHWYTEGAMVHNYDNTDHFMMMSEDRKLFCINSK